MPDSITPEMRDLQQEVYEAARDEGFDLVGRSDWTELETARAGSKDTEGLDIGVKGELNVPIGADGRLVNRAPDRAPGDPGSTHLLVLDVRPFVEFDGDGHAHVRWISNVRVIELTKNRIVLADDSSDEAGITAAQGGRPYHEYMNDSEYRNTALGFHHDNPRDAVRQALRRIGSGGVINLPEPPRATGAPPAPEPAERTGPPWGLIGGAAAAIAAIVIGIVAFAGGGDDEAADDTTGPPASAAVSTTVAATTTIAATTTTVATTTTAVTTTTTTTAPSTTTTVAPVVFTELPVLDQRCFDMDTGDDLDACLFPVSVSVDPADPISFLVELPPDAPPDVAGILTVFYGNGPGPDVLVECSTERDCRAFLTPSFFGLEYDVPPFVATAGASEIEFSLTGHRSDGGSIFVDLPAATAGDGTESPGGEYQIVEASIILENVPEVSVTLIGGADTVYIP